MQQRHRRRRPVSAENLLHVLRPMKLGCSSQGAIVPGGLLEVSYCYQHYSGDCEFQKCMKALCTSVRCLSKRTDKFLGEFADRTVRKRSAAIDNLGAPEYTRVNQLFSYCWCSSRLTNKPSLYLHVRARSAREVEKLLTVK